MGLDQHALPVFAGHQTFHPRFGWLKKGLDACAADPNVFNAEDAPLRLGVGKNMVEAIRFWCLATRVIVRVKSPEGKRQYLHVPTKLGQSLLSENGLDPYFEQQGTLWLLHWQATSSRTLLPVWWCAFNELQALEFDDEQLLALCEEEIEASTWTAPVRTSVKKDVDCLLRMYSRRRVTGRQTVDDLLDSPFRELGLIQPSAAEANAFRFARGPKASLPSAVTVYAALDYLARSDIGAGTVSVSRLASDDGGPGRLFKITDDVILSALEEHLGLGAYSLASPGGAPQVVVDLSPEEAATKVLVSYYRPEESGPTPGWNLAGEDARAAAVSIDPQLSIELPSRRRRKGSAAWRH